MAYPVTDRFPISMSRLSYGKETIMFSQEWQDKRSRPIGCCAGNVILSEIASSSEVLKRIKGTMFGSDRRVIVGRIAHAEYLTGDHVHFANLSREHYQNVREYAAEECIPEIYGLFITISSDVIDYWLVPWNEVGRVISRAAEKEKSDERIVRIQKDEERYLMLGHDVTQYHRQLMLNPSLKRRLKLTQKHSSRRRTVAA